MHVINSTTDIRAYAYSKLLLAPFVNGINKIIYDLKFIIRIWLKIVYMKILISVIW
jgi:hypothetical protein